MSLLTWTLHSAVTESRCGFPWLQRGGIGVLFNEYNVLQVKSGANAQGE
jgi:hypothetical protein